MSSKEHVEDTGSGEREKEPTIYENYLARPSLFYFLKALLICFLATYILPGIKRAAIYLTISVCLSYCVVTLYLEEEFSYCILNCKAVFITYLFFSFLAFLRVRHVLPTIYNMCKCPSPKLTLEAWTPKWGEDFLKEKERVEAVLRPKYEQFFKNKKQGLVHIGSTSIKNIRLAKPIHDIGLYWNTNDTIPAEFWEDMDKLDYFYVGPSVHSLGPYDHWFFHKTTTFGSGFDFHVTQPESHDWLDNTLAFSRYLTENPEARKRYEDVKQEGKSKEMDGEAYTRNKQKVLAELFNEAAEWSKNNKIE